MIDKQKAVVTGAAGFIGSNLVEALIEEGWSEIIAVDSFITGSKRNINNLPKSSGFKFFEGDIRDTGFLQKAFNGADCVFHQAAIPSVPRSIKFPLESHEVNVDGSLNVFLVAKEAKVRRVIYASSSSVYGDSPTLPKIETMTYNPLSFYAAHKMMNEYCGKMFHQFYGLETVGLRYFNIFGPRQDSKSEYSAVIPIFIKKILSGEPPIIYGNGSATRDFTFVKNAVSANLKAAFAEGISGEMFNVAGGTSISLNDLVKKINEILGTNIEPRHSKPRPGDIKDSLADISKAEKMLDYKVLVGFEEGLKETVKFFQNND